LTGTALACEDPLAPAAKDRVDDQETIAPARGGLAETLDVYRTVLANGSLRRVLVAFLIFNAQEYATWIAITLYAYDRGGAALAGTIAVVQLVPAALCAPLASVLGDRMRRDRALAIGYVAQAVSGLLCGLALLAGLPLLVYATAALSTCTITLTRPVHHAILPDLAATPHELTAANSASSSAEGFGIMAGPLLNALLISISGFAAVMLVFAGLVAIAALLTFRLRLQEVSASSEASQGVVAAALEGVHALGDDLPAAGITVFGGAQFLVIGMLDIFYAVLAIDVIGAGEEGAGLLAAAVGVGGIVGATATAVLVGRRRLATPIEVAVGLTAGAIACLALVSAMGPALLVLVVAGAARSFFDVAARTLLQRSVRADVLSRVFGLQEAMLMIGLAVGAAIAPVFVTLFGHRGAFIASGGLLFVAGAVVWPSMALLDRRAHLPDPERFALFRSLDLFAPLPQGTLEQLADRAFPASLPAGEVLIREGDVGDRFYVITSGEADVESGDRVVHTHRPGAYVGEIALLRDIPRTATVRARTDLGLLVLERDDFLDAVTGSRRSSRRAHAESDRRLAGLEGGAP
jgi:MFS family permease